MHALLSGAGLRIGEIKAWLDPASLTCLTWPETADALGLGPVPNKHIQHTLTGQRSTASRNSGMRSTIVALLQGGTTNKDV